MQIRPILAALRRHRLASLLIVCQIALACTVLCNASFLIMQRVRQMEVPSGIDASHLAMVRITGYDTSQASDVNARMQQALGSIPGVESVSVINTVPFDGPYGNAGITLDPAGKHFGGVVHFYVGGPGSFKALGLKLIEGRAPNGDDFQPAKNFVPANATVWITRALARHLWPHGSPLGKSFWVTKKFHFRVAGIVQRLVRPQPYAMRNRPPQGSVFVSALPGSALTGSYLVRAPAGQLDRIVRQARMVVAKMGPEVVLDSDGTGTLTALRDSYFQTDRSMIGLLAGVIAAILLVTVLGIVGLASFWVGQRRKQIGVRRALGATQGDILRYFQTENFLITSIGIVLGMALAVGANLVLMKFFELPRLPMGYLPIAAVALWVLGQLAVLAPALRASRVPPVVATRSV